MNLDANRINLNDVFIRQETPIQLALSTIHEKQITHCMKKLHSHTNNLLDASAIKWATPDLCLVLSESDSKIYINFDFCEEKNSETLKKRISEHGGSGVQVGHTEQAIV